MEDKAMRRTIEVVYENGVFKPLGKIDLKEHQRIEIFIKEKGSIAKRSQGIVKAASDAIEEVALNPEYSCLEE